MATRWPFGGELAAYVFDLDDDFLTVVEGGQTVTFWSDRLSGNQYIDLADDVGGTMPLSSVTIDDGTGTYGRGFMPVFYGPPDVTSMWASANSGPRRKLNTNVPDVVAVNAATAVVTETTTKIDTLAYNVKDRPPGAPIVYGDGIHDDTAALNAVFTAAPPGSIVRLPAGVFLVSSTGDPNGLMLKIAKQNITLEGAGSRSTIIKVKNGNGDYAAVISDGTALGTTNVSGFTMRNLTIDQNSANNTIANPAANPGLFHGFPRLAVRVYNGFDVTIRDCQFVNGDNVNTILANGGPTLISRWAIENCVFAGTGANSPFHDHSSIYFHGDSIRVAGCTFLGAGPSAVAAIETHGSNQTIVNNTVDAYASMGNITGVALVTKNVLFAHNIGTRLGCGLQLWAYNTVGGVFPGLDNVMILNNKIEIDYDRWKTPLSASYRFGIALSPTSTGVVRVVRIEGNQITYLPHTQTPSSSDNQSAGILWQRAISPTIGFADEDIEIIGNVIRGPLSAGIYVQPKFKTRRLKISGNRIIDPGQGAPNTAYRVGLFVACESFPLEDAELSNNDLIDTNGQTHVVSACVDTQFTDSTKNCRMYDNTVRCQDNASVPVHKGDPGTAAAWLIRANMSIFAAPAGVWSAGSVVTETDTGQIYTQTVAPAGASWTIKSGATASSNVFRSGRYYRSEGVGVNTTPTKSLMYLTPFTVGAARFFDRIGLSVVTGVSGTIARIGVYGSDINGVPLGLPKQVAQVATDTAGDKEVTIALTLSPGLFWLACVVQGGGTIMPVLKGLSAAGGQSTGVAAGSTLAEATANTPRTAYTQSGVTGALPTVADNGSTSLAPAIALRVIGTTAPPPPPDDPEEEPETPPVIVPPTPTTYRASGRFLFDPLGAKVVVRGPEQNFGGVEWLSNSFVTEIGKSKANAVRLIPHYQINPAFGGSRSTLGDMEDQIRRGIDSHMLVDFAVDGGKEISTWLRADVIALIKKYERFLVLHLKGESYEDTDNEWRDTSISWIQQIRNKGVKCPLYILTRDGGRRLPAILNVGAQIVAGDPQHNIVFGWQAYWGANPPATLDYIGGGWQDNFNMSLRQALQACRDAPFPIQVGLIDRSDHQDEGSLNRIPYGPMMELCRDYQLGWLWWDWRMGIDDMTPDGIYPNWHNKGQEVAVTLAGSWANTSVRTPWMLAQSAP